MSKLIFVDGWQCCWVCIEKGGVQLPCNERSIALSIVINSTVTPRRINTDCESMGIVVGCREEDEID